MRQYKVGDIVLVKCTSLVIEEDTLGYVYNIYPDFDNPARKGVMIVTEEGEDLQGFSFEEQQKMLIFITESPVIYQWRSSRTHEIFIDNDSFRDAIQSLEGDCADYLSKEYPHYWTKRYYFL